MSRNLARRKINGSLHAAHLSEENACVFTRRGEIGEAPLRSRPWTVGMNECRFFSTEEWDDEQTPDVKNGHRSRQQIVTDGE